MADWIHLHPQILIAAGFLSIITLIGSLFLLPLLIIRIPENYFIKTETVLPLQYHPLLKGLLLFGKNLAGLLLITAGLVMLFIPGQGVLTVFAGLLLTSIPGKQRLERWIISRPIVMRAINFIRSKAGRPNLLLK